MRKALIYSDKAFLILKTAVKIILSASCVSTLALLSAAGLPATFPVAILAAICATSITYSTAAQSFSDKSNQLYERGGEVLEKLHQKYLDLDESLREIHYHVRANQDRLTPEHVDGLINEIQRMRHTNLPQSIKEEEADRFSTDFYLHSQHIDVDGPSQKAQSKSSLAHTCGIISFVVGLASGGPPWLAVAFLSYGFATSLAISNHGHLKSLKLARRRNLATLQYEIDRNSHDAPWGLATRTYDGVIDNIVARLESIKQSSPIEQAIELNPTPQLTSGTTLRKPGQTTEHQSGSREITL